MSNKRLVMVTGGTGSFGNAFINTTRDNFDFIVYSRDESKQHDMWLRYRGWPIEYVIGDVRDRQKLMDTMHGVDYVIHAAALKHVPTGEIFPEEIIETNTIGTKNVIEAAEYCNVRRCVILSTDKAAYPLSAYGMSKALAEKIVMAHKGNTINVCLRYGNVLGSRGSVVPLFLEQISRNQLITITNQNMTRFVLTLQEAVKLSLKCLSGGISGDLVVMKPPACSIATLVKALELHFGRELPKTFIGIRPGEKMHEVLLTSDEVARATIEEDDKITYARVHANTNKNYFDCGSLRDEPKDFSSLDAVQLNPQQVLAKLKEAKLL